MFLQLFKDSLPKLPRTSRKGAHGRALESVHLSGRGSPVLFSPVLFLNQEPSIYSKLALTKREKTKNVKQAGTHCQSVASNRHCKGVPESRRAVYTYTHDHLPQNLYLPDKAQGKNIIRLLLLDDLNFWS